MSTWAQVSGTLILGLVGLYLGHSYRRQTRARLAEARRSAYSQLWEATGLATPTRLDGAGRAGLLAPNERDTLYQRLTTWYYQDGNGMLLESTTRQLYLNAKYNLTCEESQLRPPGLMALLPDTMTPDEKRGCLAIRQLSLLRTQMKTDLAIYGRPYVGRLTSHEVAFLRCCRVNLRRRPWRAAVREALGTEMCGEAKQSGA